jgi:hypothetical protein
MKKFLIRVSRSLSIVILPGMTLLLPTYPLPVQLGYAVVVMIIAQRSVEQWSSPYASRADRIVAALAAIGVVVSGVVFILMAASALYRFIHLPSAPVTLSA